MVPGIIFLALLATYIVVYLRIAEHLKDHHTNVWVGLGMPSGVQPDTNEVTPEFLAEQSLAAFLLKGKVSRLNDSRLNMLVLLWRLLGMVAIPIFVLLFFFGYI